MALSIGQFAGIAPKLSPPLLPENSATVAQNLRVDRGSIRSLKGLTLSAAVPGGLGFIPKSMFKYGAPAWLYWSNPDVDVCRSPVPNDAWGRIYYTGGEAAYPQYTFSGRPTAPGLPQGMRLGVPQPGAAMLSSVTKSGVASGTAYDRYYVFSYVTPLGEEGPPIAAPKLVAGISSTETATLTFNTESVGAYNLGVGAFRRIYRTAQGTDATTFNYVADVPIGTLTYADSKLDAELGEILPSSNWFPPPAAMVGLKSTANGFFIGYTSNALCVSERFMPHAWAPSNQLSFPGTITALAVTSDSIVVFTTDMPYLVTGTDPAGLTAIKIDNPQSVPYRKSAVDMGGYVMAASPDGLLRIVQNSLEVATQGHLTLEQWADYSPSTLRGFFYEGIYVGFSSTAAFMFDTRSAPATLTTLTGFPSIVAGYNDLVTDTLYLLDSSGNIYTWETGSLSTFTWKSKPVRVAMPSCPACARVWATGPVTLQLWADGESVFGPVGISDNEVVRLPGDYRAREFQIQLSGQNTVEAISIANSIAELS